MDKDPESPTLLRPPPESGLAKPLITPGRLWMITFVFILVSVAIILPWLSDKSSASIIFIIPVLVLCMFILRDPYNGIYLYFLYEFLRPYDFIPGLGPLRLAMMIEIITLISWILHLIRTRKTVKWANFNWMYIAFIGIIAITVITAANNRYAYNTFQLMGVNFAVFLVATNVVDTPKRLTKLIWLLLIIHVYFALKGIYNFAILHTTISGQITSGRVGSGYIGDEGDYALSFNVMLPFAFFMLIYSRKKVKKFVSGFILLVFAFAIVSSFSRGGWVGLVAVIIYFVLASKRKLATLGYTLLLATVFILYAPSTYWDEIKTIKETRKGTAETRRRYWDAAFRMYLDHPIVGVGAGNGGVWMPAYVTGFRYPGTQWGRAFHGTIPQVMAELGSLGLVLYLWMVIYVIRRLRLLRKRKGPPGNPDFSRYVADSVLGGIIAFFVTGFFLSTAYYPQLWTLYAFAMILHFCRGAASIDSVQGDYAT